MEWRRWLRALAGGDRLVRRTRPIPLRLEALEDRCLLAAWAPQVSGTGLDLLGVWGSGPNDVFAVGVGGLIEHSPNDGASWQTQNSGTTQFLEGVWGSGPNDVFAVGSSGVILHATNDGASWQAQTSGTTQFLTGVWGSGPNDVFAVGGSGVIQHSTNDGTSWQAQNSGTTQDLDGVWGSGPQRRLRRGQQRRDPAFDQRRRQLAGPELGDREYPQWRVG